jgi:hypothetical protein
MSAARHEGAGDAPTDLRLRLRANGYRPVPVSGPDMRVGSAGKRPVMNGWQTICATADEAEIRRWATAERRCTNTGLLCGEVAAVDIDIPAPALAEQVEKLAEMMLGPTPLRRIGRQPKVVRCYRVAAPLRKLATPELLLPDGTKAQVEVLGAGQQFVAYGIHPDTRQPYGWPQEAPTTVPLADVPVVTEAALRAFVAAAEAMIRGAGGRTAKEAEGRASGATRPVARMMVARMPAARRPGARRLGLVPAGSAPARAGAHSSPRSTSAPSPTSGRGSPRCSRTPGTSPAPAHGGSRRAISGAASKKTCRCTRPRAGGTSASAKAAARSTW